MIKRTKKIFLIFIIGITLLGILNISNASGLLSPYTGTETRNRWTR